MWEFELGEEWARGAVRWHFECKGLWLLKNSCFPKTAEIWAIANVYQKGDRRL
jgi:hypothetical protein